jgi:molecular chaperone GrpE
MATDTEPNDAQSEAEAAPPTSEADPPTEAATDVAPAPETLAGEDYRDKYLRAAADLENLRKRAAREIARAVQRERTAMLRDLTGVLDNLERALDAARGESSPWLEGVEAIRGQMLEVLKKHGATPFASMGEKFDPRRHEAVATVDLADREEGTIADVVQIGYEKSDGTVLRPARVIVVRHG